MSSKTELLRKFATIVAKSNDHFNFNGKTLDLVITEVRPDFMEDVARELILSHEVGLNGNFSVQLNRIIDEDVLIFVDSNDFANRAYEFINKLRDFYILILHYNGTYLLMEPGEDFSSEKALVVNFYFYHEILLFLQAQDNFATVHTKPERQFIIFSSELGPFHLGYNLHESRVGELDNLEPILNRLKKEFEKVDFVQFFKSAVINGIHSYTVNERFYYLVHSLVPILSIAERDHYIYIQNFDFEKVKSKFKEGKNRYFDDLEKGIEAVNKQVSSFPLTFAASIFAAYQVKERPAILILIGAAYLLYTIIAFRIVNVTIFNVATVKEDVKDEKDRIRNGYEVLYAEFEKDFQHIDTKIYKIERLITLLKTVLVGLMVCFAAFAVYQFLNTNQIKTPVEVKIVD